MKLPSLFPVGLFAGGILLSIDLKKCALLSPRILIAAALLLFLFGYIALRRNWIFAAALFAAGTWLSLGMAASHLERVSVPSNLASTLIESGKLDSSTALRWRGRLRSDPLPLPWGMRYEISLDEVDSSAGITPVAGGLRLTYYTAESFERSRSASGARRGSRRKPSSALVLSAIMVIPAASTFAAISLARTSKCRARCGTARC